MKISRQCLLILSENKETGAKVVISKGREKKARSHGAPSSHAFESIFFFPDFLLQICIISDDGVDYLAFFWGEVFAFTMPIPEPP